MIIKITNSKSYCLEGTVFEYTFLYNKLGVKVPNAWHIQSVKEGRWDGYYRFFNNHGKYFPTGLLTTVKKYLDEAGIKYNIIDERIKPVKQFKINSNIELKSYQKRVFDIIKNEDRGIIWLPVNAGKTYIAMQLIAELGVRTLWITRSIELLRQTKKLLEENLNITNIGIIGAGIFDIQPITLGMIQTLSKNAKNKLYMKDISDSFDMVIFDEVHAVAKNTYERFVTDVDVYYKFGLSGTPKHRSDVDVTAMIGAFGDVIVKMDSKTLEELGVSVPADINMIEIDNPKNNYEYTEAYDELIVNNENRNSIIAGIANDLMSSNKQTIIMVDRIAHGDLIKECLKTYSIDAPFIYGEHTPKERQAVIDSFEAGDTKVLIASTILNEGLNIKSIDCIIVAGAGMSPIKTIQRVGRVLRKRIGKDRALVIDFWDKNNAFLEAHSKKRLSTYKFEFGDVTLIEL